jgi:hypothetical protein
MEKHKITEYGDYIHNSISSFNYDLKIKDYDKNVKGICLNNSTDNINLLSNFKSIETIKCFRVTNEQIKDFPLLTSVKHLIINCVNCSSLDFLSKFPNLIYLNIDGFDNLESLEGIKNLIHLEYLSLVNNKKLVNYDEIESLTELNNLRIEGGFSSVFKLGNLNFLKNLNLLRLDLKNVSVNKNNLLFIANLKNLQKLGLAINFKVEEIAYLKGALPNAKCYDFEPYHTELDKFENLKKCNICNENIIRLTGKVKPQTICPKCDVDILNSHLEIFNLSQQKGQKHKYI